MVTTIDFLIGLIIFGMLFTGMIFSIKHKHVIFAIFFILFTITIGYFLVNEYKNSIISINVQSTIEQTNTIVSYKVLQSGMRIPIDTIEVKIKIPDKQFNY